MNATNSSSSYADDLRFTHNGTFVLCTNDGQLNSCAEALGHNRGGCVTRPKTLEDAGYKWDDDETTICMCHGYYGFRADWESPTLPKGCGEGTLARFRFECIVGSERCNGHSSVAAINTASGTINSLLGLVMIGLAIKLLVQIRFSPRYKGWNDACTVLLTAAIAGVGIVIWAITYIIVPNSGSAWYSQNMMPTAGVPLTAIFFVMSGLNVPLTWASVVKSSKTMRKKGAGGGGKSVKYALWASSMLFGVTELVVMVILGNNALGSMISIFFVIICISGYLYYSTKLSRLLSGSGESSNKKKPPAIMMIIKTARRVGIIMTLYLCSAIAYSLFTADRFTDESPIVFRNIVVFFMIFWINMGLFTVVNYIKFNTRKARGVKVVPSGDSSASSSAGSSSGE